ncbi:MAG: hypothetical protein KatS3mg009_1646 [Acidimicrobiia bacterium]|nr:MAG: hypothetical protein KatS3mg009_1646 [Acidimicrobiia bacterium]
MRSTRTRPDVPEGLRRAWAAPVVSVYLPFDPADGPDGNERRAAAAAEEAAAAVRARAAGPGCEELVANLADALGSVDPRHPPAGLAAFATPDGWEAAALPEPPAPRVVVDGVPALRALLLARQRTPDGRALLISARGARLVDLVGGHAAEHEGDGFPVRIDPPVEADAPHGDFPLDEHERAEARRFVFRAVDHTLAPLQRREPLPLVLVGETRDLAYYDEVTRLGPQVVGRVRGSHEHDPPHAVAPLVLDALRRHVEADATEVARRALEALPAGAVAGVDAVAEAARAGRGRELVVEEGLGAAADDGGDLVERIVAEVVAHGGDVVHVPAGVLAGVGGVVLTLRY